MVHQNREVLSSKAIISSPVNMVRIREWHNDKDTSLPYISQLVYQTAYFLALPLPFIYYMSSYKADVRSANRSFWQQPAQLTWPGARWDEKAPYSPYTLSSPEKGGIPPFHPPQVYAPQHSHGFLKLFMIFPPEFCLRSVSVLSFKISVISVYDNELFLWICGCM